MEKQKPYLLAFKHLNQRKLSLSFKKYWKKILQPTSKAKAGAVFIYSVHPRRMLVFKMQSSSS